MLVSHFNLQKPESSEDDEEETKPPKPRPPPGVHEYVPAEESIAAEEKVHAPERRLNKSEVSVRLSMLGKTAEGDGYAYLKANITKLELTHINTILCFKHIQYLDISNNYITDETIQVISKLPYLVLIQANKNKLTSGYLKRMKYLQVMILNENHISSVHDIYQPELSTLEAASNGIMTVSFENRMSELRCLDLRNNLIRDISEINFPKLDSLYLAGNRISSLVGIERLVNLRVLHVRNNPIKLLNGFSPAMAKLQYLNVRNCKVGTLIQVKKLRVLPALDTLIMKGTPYMGGTGKEQADAADEEEDAEVRVEMLAALPKLKRINKIVITPEERAEAKELMTQWLEDGEKDEEEIEAEQQEEEEAVDNED